MSSSMLTRIAISLCAAWAVMCVGWIALQAVRNPMHAREDALETTLAGVAGNSIDLPNSAKPPLLMLRPQIVGKKALWSELVAAPPAPPKPQADPNLKEKLKGVTATRQTIARGDAVLVKFYLGPQDKAGAWKTVGEDINGLTIREITTEAVVFGIKQGEKEYTVELPRR